MTQTKNKSHSAFQQGVANVNELLSDGERIILLVLAVAVDYRTGTSHPGNAALMRQSGRCERTVQEILKKLRTRGLLEMASKGDGGRGLATVHRFCVEDERYPEPKPRSNTCGDSESKPRSQNEKPRRSEQETPQIDGGNPAAWDAPHPLGHPANPSQPPSPTKKAAEGGKDSQNPKAAAKGKWTGEIFAWMQREFYRVTERPLILSSKSRDALAPILGDQSQDAVKVAFSRLLDRERGWNGLSDPSSVIVGELPAYLQIARIDLEKETKRAETDAIIESSKAMDREQAEKNNAAWQEKMRQEEAEMAALHENPNLMGDVGT